MSSTAIQSVDYIGPRYYLGTQQGELLETLRLLVELDDDVEAVADRRGESTQTVLSRLRANGVKLLTAEERAAKHYQKVLAARAVVGYDRNAVADYLNISRTVLAYWLQGSQPLLWLRKERSHKERLICKQKALKEKAQAGASKHSCRDTEQGLDRLALLPGIGTEVGDLAVLLNEYIAAKGTDLESSCIEKFYPLLKKFCYQYAWRQGMEAAEMMTDAFLALKECLDCYDPVKTKTPKLWLMQMLHNRVLDQLRKIDPIPRTTRRLSKQLDNLLESCGGNATDDWILEQTGWDYQTLILIRDRHAISIDVDIKSDGAVTTIASTLPGREDRSSIIAEDLEYVLCAAHPSERHVLSLYFLEDLTMLQVAERMELSESRVCQLINGAIESIRKRLLEQEERKESARSK